MMHSIIEDLSPESLALANEANYVEFVLHRRAWHKTTVYDEPEMVMAVTDIPVPLFNVVTRVRLSPDNLDKGIEKAIGRFKEKAVPGNWHVGPASQPSDIGNALQAYGFIQTANEPGMAIDLDDLKDVVMPSDFVIEPIRTRAQVDACIEVALQGFGMPDFLKEILLGLITSLGLEPESSIQNYLGVLDNKPVAVSTVYYGAGVAGIYNVTTLAEARGRGIGTAMTVKPLLDARLKGYRVGILQSSEMGYSVYERIGFREVCKIDIYTWRQDR
jgi:predicted GNAT family acetyltransferase